MEKNKKFKKLVIVDISSFIFRAYYAIRHNMTAPDGTPTNAVSGVLSMLQKLFSQFPHDHFVLAKDTKGDTFRNEIYPNYKANRSAPPEDLIPQFSLIDKLIQKMEIPYVAMDNFEADDIIGSMCVQWRDSFEEIFIASGDKDLMQFVGGPIKMLDTMKGVVYDDKAVFEKMGVWPSQIVDYLSIVGDSSDNIPGMRGIGPKGASQLLAEHKDLETCIKMKDTFKGKKLTNAFENHLEEGLLSKKLVQIKIDLDLGMRPEDTEFHFYPKDDLIIYLTDLGFKSAVEKLKDLALNDKNARENDEGGVFKIINTIPEKKEFICETKVIDTDKDFVEVLQKIKEQKNLSFYTEYEDINFLERKLVSITISLDGKSAFFFPFLQNNQKNLSQDHLKNLMEYTWCDGNKEISSSHPKRDYRHCLIHGHPYNAKILDVTQMHYLLDTTNNHDLGYIAKKHLGIEITKIEKKDTQINDLDSLAASEINGPKSCAIFQLSEKFLAGLKENKLEHIYNDLDRTLIPVLAKMEKKGVLLNPIFFKELEDEYSLELEKIVEQVKESCKKAKVEWTDEGINLRSPKQVSELLFEKLGLPVIAKTKTGASTNSDVLEELVFRDLSDIPELILQFRELDKLLSTYVKALPELINPISKRVHTNFGQHTAQTGRLASVNPNLQNIPVRSINGRRIRKGFIAGPGNVLLSADYSQVELRLLAHFSEDPIMVSSFKADEDIHRQTAAEIMDIPINKVTKEQREGAKAVNFGLMYGQSSFGLARQLRISRNEAKDYITTYFTRFSQVKSYLDSLREMAEQKGYSETLMGRKRFLPDIHHKNRNIKAQAERMAINSPIQGTAADILKKAMIDIDKSLEEQNLNSKMLLQVHDELIFEVPEKELKTMRELIKDKMENVVKLKVPLKVDMRYGVNWFDLK